MDHDLYAVPRQKYCESLHKTVRRKTSTVMVGNVAIGSQHPIRVQTMTTTDTKDVAATVEQVLQMLFCFMFLRQISVLAQFPKFNILILQGCVLIVCLLLLGDENSRPRG